MITKINIEEFISLAGTIPVIDVRSPSEYKKGHIPGAINIPLFDDEERKIIGTLYIKKSREASIQKGFEFVAAKYSSLIESGKKAAVDYSLLIYCWRGGMRSASLAWLYEHLGIDCQILEGGYKSFRSYLRSFFKQEIKIKIIGGMTGSRKTEILKELERAGEQIVDLEGIACHKGSAFGSLGEKEQPENEHFENLLFLALSGLDLDKRIWLEDESRNIGKVFIPVELFDQIRRAQVFIIDLERQKRINHLVQGYSFFPDTELVNSIKKISKKIGGQNAKIAIEAIQNKDYSKAVEISLYYYDKAYKFGLNKREKNTLVTVSCEDLTPMEIAERVLEISANPKF